MNLTPFFSQPSQITFVCAMKQLGAGFREMAKAQGDIKTGLVASEASITFNVTASAKDTSKLFIDLSIAPVKPYPKIGNVGGEVTGSSEGQRGNTITIKFVSLLNFAKDGMAKNAKDLTGTLNDGDVHIFNQSENSKYHIPSAEEIPGGKIVPKETATPEEKCPVDA